MKFNKKERARKLLIKNHGLFKCPVCSSGMFMNDGYSMVCTDNHSFDLSRKGYLNLLISGNKPVYPKELFKARQEVCRAGFFTPLIIELTGVIEKYQESIDKIAINVLDAGCGEGSHLYGIFERVKDRSGYNFMGVDISKDAVNTAARHDSDIIWCVADLSRLPVQDRSFDIILNVLSPANYAEFERVLSDSGIIIKVVPGDWYLRELREIFYKDKEKAHYSNREVTNHFKKNLKVIDMQNINYEFPVGAEILPHIIKMTPLSWGRNAEKINNKLKESLTSITVDLTVIVGVRRLID